MDNRLIQNVKFVHGLAPAADGLAGTKYTQVCNMRDYQTATFLIYSGDVSSGTSVVTCEKCSNSAAGAVTAINFRYKEQSTTLGADSHADLATGANFTLTAAVDNQVDIVEVDAAELGTYSHVRLKFVEGVDHPRPTAVLICLSGGRYQGDDKRTVLV